MDAGRLGSVSESWNRFAQSANPWSLPLRRITPKKRTIESSGNLHNPTPLGEKSVSMSNPEEMKSWTDLLEQADEMGVTPPESPGSVFKRMHRLAGSYPIRNLAVDLCSEGFARWGKKAHEEGKSSEAIRRAAKLGYCSLLPPVSGATNIRDFIACVTYGMAVGIIPAKEGTSLLYGAQVAHTALTKRPKKRNKSSHTRTTKSATNSEESAS
jgi:hypothetical protein